MSCDEYDIVEVDNRKYRVKKSIQPHLSVSNELSEKTSYDMKEYCDEPDCIYVPSLSSKEQVEEIFKKAEITPRTTDCTIKLLIPNKLHGQIIGKGGINISPIKEECQCKIAFASSDDTPDLVRIEGVNEDKVREAMERLKNVCINVFCSLKSTHTIQIPFKSSDLLKQIEIFQEQLVKIDGLNPNYLQKPQALHLTLTTLSICTEQQVEVASKLLEDMAPRIYSILNNKPLLFELCGISAMGNEEATRVIYIKVKTNDEQINKIIEEIKQTFNKYLDKQNQSEVILHMTLFNTNKLKNGKSFVIDASDIVRKYTGKSFGKYKAESLVFSSMINKIMGTKYALINSIPLP
ncbi:activating signal cointegrator 1 complex subunit 1, putative [Entamoeba histolytica HM-3:IMSS]|uniref:Activating signal cointegrator 1 complex subunit 1, putative n=5 Tax=Entamoeba histolytica TaxID=5759 RepID=C4M534_ENTH1|nr:activating signal cointegrator 1 complex subunit 1, putative [Entamoeba histolytica HM-1:IMSS]EMD44432.1 activating signal cointegrator 1 complex subunit 1, putative [Entamoeba histolytica KU27]EMS12828.1 activating signal cointegrator 1 complex subunit 1, putative [Entamoeba histolytica HM-3:IMSS]ENY63316.1 activating signal cointegrator 1 complex subunit 1, putative [Entamoeba histolytica HM-1:IMSS-A]GAT96507.1 RNA-binding protein putative [Entamoeba histolytica]EAL49371.1 activating sign|eukprot:XP_654759.1 activating signal cointegrator 1 complex subunit 1, putative [Entamoeba histolytica HM-1:IMSS]